MPDCFFNVPQAQVKKYDAPSELGEIHARLCLGRVRGTVPRCYRKRSGKLGTSGSGIMLPRKSTLSISPSRAGFLQSTFKTLLELTQRQGGIYMEGMPTLRVSLRDFHRMWLSIPLLGRRLSAWPGYKLEIRRPKPDLSFWVGDLPDRFFNVPQAPSKKITMPPSGSLGFQARLCLGKVGGTVPSAIEDPVRRNRRFQFWLGELPGRFLFSLVSPSATPAHSPCCPPARFAGSEMTNARGKGK